MITYLKYLEDNLNNKYLKEFEEYHKYLKIYYSENSKCPVKVGDRVLYQRYSGLDVQWDGTNYHIIMANDLVAIINKDETTQFELKENA